MDENESAMKKRAHFAIAEEMIKTIIECQPAFQNEIVKHIINIVREHRKIMIEKAERELCYLKDSIKPLNEPYN